jgi:hypothetical protein
MFARRRRWWRRAAGEPTGHESTGRFDTISRGPARYSGPGAVFRTRPDTLAVCRGDLLGDRPAREPNGNTFVTPERGSSIGELPRLR